MLSTLKEVLKLVRWFHELLAILPFVALYAIIRYYSIKNEMPCELSGTNFIILCIAVQLLLAAGCILNDIMDRDIDEINKPHTRVVGRTISLVNAKRLFIAATLLIIILSVYISVYMFKEWAFIAICVYTLSILYDVYFKRSALLGNILMAGLASFIPLIILFFAKECITALNNEKVYTLIYLYAAFPFLIIIARELSLDISDMVGDKADGCNTLPIVIGAKKSKVVVMAILLLIIVLSVWIINIYPYLMSTFVVIDGLLLVYMYLLQKTETRIQYIRIGRFLWFIMILGLLGATVASV
ncbi:MAG: UbiA family prenyltransferase [Bacteroidota bacterium]